MAITNKLITFNKLTSFETQLAQGNILDTSIVFIKDAKKIWTKGTYFDCDSAALREEIINNEEVVAAALNDLQENKASKTYVDEAVANAGGGSDDIYVFEPTDFTQDDGMTLSGTLTLEEYEKIVNCRVLCLSMAGSTVIFTTKLAIYENIIICATAQLGEFDVTYVSCVFEKSGDIARWTMISNSVTFKTINGEEILGEGDITIENVTEETVSNWGFTKNAGTVTGVKINGTNKTPSSGVVDLGSVGTLTTVATQETIDSVDGFKTINGQSIIGSGNIEISGVSSGGSSVYSEVNHGTNDTTFTLTPNTFHVWDEVSSLTLTLGSETSGVTNEFLFQFTSGSTATTLMLPDTIKWVGGDVPTISKNMIYQVSILKGLASVLGFSNPITFPVIVEGGYYPDVYSYFVDEYSLINTYSDSPSQGIMINEYLFIDDYNIGGIVTKVSLFDNNLLLWTENSEHGYSVIRINSNTFIASKYEWD